MAPPRPARSPRGGGHTIYLLTIYVFMSLPPPARAALLVFPAAAPPGEGLIFPQDLALSTATNAYDHNIPKDGVHRGGAGEDRDEDDNDDFKGASASVALGPGLSTDRPQYDMEDLISFLFCRPAVFCRIVDYRPAGGPRTCRFSEIPTAFFATELSYSLCDGRSPCITAVACESR